MLGLAQACLSRLCWVTAWRCLLPAGQPAGPCWAARRCQPASAASCPPSAGPAPGPASTAWPYPRLDLPQLPGPTRAWNLPLQGPRLHLPEAAAVPLSAGTAGIVLSFVLSPAELVKVRGRGVFGVCREQECTRQAACARSGGVRSMPTSCGGATRRVRAARGPPLAAAAHSNANVPLHPALSPPCTRAPRTPPCSAACRWAALSGTTPTPDRSTACARRCEPRGCAAWREAWAAPWPASAQATPSVSVCAGPISSGLAACLAVLDGMHVFGWC